MSKGHIIKTFVLGLILLCLHHVSRASDELQVAFAQWIEPQYEGPKAFWPPERKQADQERIIREYEANPTNATITRRFMVALAYGYCGELEKAAPLLKSIPEGKAESDPALYLLGAVELVEGQVDEGIHSLQKSWDHGFRQALPFLAVGYARAGNHKEFEKLTDEIFAQMPNYPPLVDAVIVSSSKLHPFNTNWFLKAAENISDTEIASRSDAEFEIFVQGLWETGRKTRARAVIVAGEPQHGERAIDCLAGPREYREQVIKDYEQNPKDWKPDELLLAAICYASEREYQKGKSVYEKYLATHPDSKRALRGLGMMYFLDHDFPQAKTTLKKGWERGDLNSLKGLASVYISLNEHEEMRPLLPDLLAHRKEDSDLIVGLIVWAVNSPHPDQKVFEQAIDGLSDEAIIEKPDLCHTVIQGLRKFGDNARAERLKEKAAKLKMI